LVWQNQGSKKGLLLGMGIKAIVIVAFAKPSLWGALRLFKL